MFFNRILLKTFTGGLKIEGVVYWKNFNLGPLQRIAQKSVFGN